MAATLATVQAQTTDLHQTFLNPPEDAKPMVRWWWFGPAVTPEEIRKEIDQMHAGGFGGFELASVYPLAVDDPAEGIRNLRYTSPEMVDMLRAAQEHGRELGMRVDLTLGSGWPFGGPEIPLELAAERLKLIVVSNSDKAPQQLDSQNRIEPGDHIIAKFLAAGTPEHWDATRTPQLEVWDKDRVVRRWTYGADTPHDVTLIFVASHTRQMVKRAAVGGEGYVLDHMNRAAIDTHNREVSDKLLQGFTGEPPYAVFSDSLEVYGSDWTGALPEEFKRRRGYDLIPHLPELWQGGTPEAEAVRHDWGVTLSDLVRENYLKPMAEFAAAHGTKFRSQTYGEPAATLSDEMTPQLAEGEGPQWNQFSFTRWASSANHVFGRNITSAETWTWLHSPAFRATPLDMKVEADRMFLEGVNQIVGHGWPYSPPYAQEPGYSLYAAAVFNAHNPWWPVMPAITKYLQRVSWLLRQGEPANDVAILLPEDDAQAAFAPGHVSVTDGMKQRITPELMGAVLNSGHNVDYIDGPALEMQALHSKVIVVPPTTRMRLKTVQALATYARRGGKVIFVDTVPSLAPGLQDANDTSALLREIARLQHAAAHTSMAQLAPTLRSLLPAAFDLGQTNGAVGFIQRSLPERDIYFVANTTPEPQTFTLLTTSAHHTLTWWDIEGGDATNARNGESVTLTPYGSRVLVASDDHAPHLRRGPEHVVQSIPLTGSTVAFDGQPTNAQIFHSTESFGDWTARPGTRFYSGTGSYFNHFAVQSMAGHHVELRFADGKPLPDTQPANKPGIRAWYDAPIREAATVLVNGKEAGVLWHPPYVLDITGLTHSGDNTIEIRVYNTAINALAGQPPRDYSALKAKYGDRFQMQDMDNLQPVSSGIFGPVEVVTLAAVK
ncbi:glycosyl hydrolase [Terriglobus sp.]|uniref:glycosyl hydrolase n=1 Tax=Terriglobus sp. TaxID=1889013 RepID=UPI003B00FD25